MKIIASTQSGFLIEATRNEVDQLLRSSGTEQPDKISDKVGQSFVIDGVTGAISNIRSIAKSYDFEQLKTRAKELNESVQRFEAQAQKMEGVQA